MRLLNVSLLLLLPVVARDVVEIFGDVDSSSVEANIVGFDESFLDDDIDDEFDGGVDDGSNNVEIDVDSFKLAFSEGACPCSPVEVATTLAIVRFSTKSISSSSSFIISSSS